MLSKDALWQISSLSSASAQTYRDVCDEDTRTREIQVHSLFRYAIIYWLHQS